MTVCPPHSLLFELVLLSIEFGITSFNYLMTMVFMVAARSQQAYQKWGLVLS